MELQQALERYAAGWTELNVIDGLIEELEDQRRVVKARQRHIANALVKAKMEAESGE